MTGSILFICNIEFVPSLKQFIDAFKEEFSHLDCLTTTIAFRGLYDDYDKDIAFLNSGLFLSPMIVDFRGNDGYGDVPTKLYLPNDFFLQSNSDMIDALLHELGHYFTNPICREIIEYSMKNKYMGSPIDINDSYMDCHNRSLSYITKIPKLALEINAELWIRENEPEFFNRRLKKYYDSVDGAISHLKGIIPGKDFFYDLPEITFFILFRLGVIQNIDFDYKEDYVSKISILNELLRSLLEKTGYGGLKQVEYQDKILKAIEHGNQDIPQLLDIFEEIYAEFVQTSVNFFKKENRTEILEQYKLD